jgi:hypothetical protein
MIVGGPQTHEQINILGCFTGYIIFLVAEKKGIFSISFATCLVLFRARQASILQPSLTDQ